MTFAVANVMGDVDASVGSVVEDMGEESKMVEAKMM